MSNNQILRSLFTSCQNVVLDGDSDSSRVTQLLCDRKSSGELIGVLSASILNKFLLTLITFGVKVPAGLFIPSLTLGACMGRLGGTFIQHLTDAYPDWLLFRECDSTSACVDGAIYAIVGAAAVLAGVTQVSLSLCVVMIELTGGLSHLLPVVVAVLSANMVTNPLGSPSIYDSIVHVNRYPYLDVNIDLDIQKASEFELRAKDIMRTNLHVSNGSKITV
mmetsp:Transcript_3319/g.15694  ORF Transcript_3319/g.15694 Transcript_3319/m.15694 type:complete len:220 (-) Transcript_3319:2207-2866(-)